MIDFQFSTQLRFVNEFMNLMNNNRFQMQVLRKHRNIETERPVNSGSRTFVAMGFITGVQNQIRNGFGAVTEGTGK